MQALGVIIPLAVNSVLEAAKPLDVWLISRAVARKLSCLFMLASIPGLFKAWIGAEVLHFQCSVPAKEGWQSTRWICVFLNDDVFFSCS